MVFSARSVFISVYASNSIIRRIFLPICSLFFFSPLLALLARAFHVDLKPPFLLLENFSASDWLLRTFVSLAGVFLVTRFLSGKAYEKIEKNDGTWETPVLPHWVPGLRHWVSFVWDGDGFLRRARDTSIHNFFAYNLAGTKHNIVLSSYLLEQIQSHVDGLSDSELTTWIVLRNAYGMPNDLKHRYQEYRREITQAFEIEVYGSPNVEQITSTVIKALEDTLPDLITFNTSMVDQMPWERVSGVELTDGTEEAEVELYALLNEFICNSIIASLTGSQFTESYQLLASDLSTLHQSFYLMAMGLPRWFPIPGLPSTFLARRRLLENLTKYFNDLSNPIVTSKSNASPDDSDNASESGSDSPTDAESPTPFSRLNKIFSVQELPMPARASIALDLLHSLTMETVCSVFWALVHIQSSSIFELTARLRKETESWAQATQPPSIHPLFPSPPQIALSCTFKDLVDETKAPLLKSCVRETHRLYSTPSSTQNVSNDITISEKGVTFTNNVIWQLQRGEVADIGLSLQLQNTSPANYIDPLRWKADRFIHSEGAPISLNSKQNTLVTSLQKAFMAGFVQLWDINGTNGTIKVPKAKAGREISWPARDVRVKIKRRDLESTTAKADPKR